MPGKGLTSSSSVYSEKKVHLDSLISRHFPASEYLEAYEFIGRERDKSMKTMIDFQD